MLIAFECDLRGHALMFIFSLRIDGKTANRYLQNFADTREAWNVILRDMGIDPETMKKVGPLTHPVLELIEKMFPEPVPENIEKLVTTLKEYYH
jgi:hypothetical protein